MKKKEQAQSLIEYTMVISVVILAITMLLPMLRRGSQSLMKAGADQIADQITGEQDFSSAYMVNSKTDFKTTSDMKKTFQLEGVSEQKKEITATTVTTLYKMTGEE